MTAGKIDWSRVKSIVKSESSIEKARDAELDEKKYEGAIKGYEAALNSGKLDKKGRREAANYSTDASNKLMGTKGKDSEEIYGPNKGRGNPIEKARDSELDYKKFKEGHKGLREALNRLMRDNEGNKDRMSITRPVREKMRDAHSAELDARDAELDAKKPGTRDYNTYGPNHGRGYSPEEIGKGKVPENSGE